MDSSPAVKGNHGMIVVLMIILVIALGVLAFVEYNKRVQTGVELRKLTIQMEQLKTGNNPQKILQAKEIVEKVKKHIIIPGPVDPTVATIVDVDTLRQRNDFYRSAKNGDHLIVTPTRAILYDPDAEIIIDVIPIQLEAQPVLPQESASGASAATEPAAGMGQ